MITFKELSLPLKIAVVTSYVTLTIYTIAFIIGFFQGLTGVS